MSDDNKENWEYTQNIRNIIENGFSQKKCNPMKNIRHTDGQYFSLDNDIESISENIFRGNGKITDHKRIQFHDEHLPSPEMFGATIRNEHLDHFYSACLSGIVRVAFIGDSIYSLGNDMISTADHPVWWMIDALQKANPSVKFEIINVCIPGIKWRDIASNNTFPPEWIYNPDNLSLLNYVSREKPDLIIMHCAGNDGYDFDSVAFNKAINFFLKKELSGLNYNPSIILGVTYQPSLSSSIGNYRDTKTQQGIDFCATFIRNWCISNNYGYLDFGRWHAMCRDGIDPCVLGMERVHPQENTTLPAYEYALSLDHKNQWHFPKAYTNAGVRADSCTSWLFCFTLSDNPQVMQIKLSSAGASSNTPMGNDLFIDTTGTTIKIQYSYGYEITPVIDTKISVPDSVQSWTITVKDSRLRIEIQRPPSNGWNYFDADAHRMGMGYVSVFDQQIARFGGEYTPTLLFARSVQITCHMLTVASSLQVESSGHRSSCNRYYPIVSNDELYKRNDEDYGGSNAYHGNLYLYRIIMSTVIYSQPWSAPILPHKMKFQSLKITHGFACHGASIPSQQPCLKLYNPTPNELALAQILECYGLVKIEN